MGQKINPNIFQLGRTKSWDFQYFETKNLDMSKYSFKNLELSKFLIKFFEDNELYICNYKIFYSENSLFIYVSYFANLEITKNFKILNKNKKKRKKRKIKITKPKKILFLKKKKNFLKVLKKSTKNKLLLEKYKKKIKIFKRKSKKIETPKHKFRKRINWKKNWRKKFHTFKRAWFLKKSKIKTFDSILKNNFLNKLFKNISAFFLKPKIILNFYQLNNFATKSFSKKEIRFIKQNLNKLRQFDETPFIRKGLQIILLCLKYNGTSEFLANYLAKELQNHKKQHFFLNFIQKALNTFNKKEFCNYKNIKIQIKGRFNGASRSKIRVLKSGNPLSVISFQTKFYYSQVTSFSPNGTFGIKIWISKTKKLNNKHLINDSRAKNIKI